MGTPVQSRQPLLARCSAAVVMLITAACGVVSDDHAHGVFTYNEVAGVAPVGEEEAGDNVAAVRVKSELEIRIVSVPHLGDIDLLNATLAELNLAGGNHVPTLTLETTDGKVLCSYELDWTQDVELAKQKEEGAVTVRTLPIDCEVPQDLFENGGTRILSFICASDDATCSNKYIGSSEQLSQTRSGFAHQQVYSAKPLSAVADESGKTGTLVVREGTTDAEKAVIRALDNLGDEATLGHTLAVFTGFTKELQEQQHAGVEDLLAGIVDAIVEAWGVIGPNLGPILGAIAETGVLGEDCNLADCQQMFGAVGDAIVDAIDQGASDGEVEQMRKEAEVANLDCMAGCEFQTRENGCFAAGTQISVAGDETLAVEQITPGTRVLTSDGRLVEVERAVLGLEEHPLVHVATVSKGELHVTRDHPMVTVGGVKRAADLTIADELVLASGGSTAITSLSSHTYTLPVFNFALAGDATANHLVIANGLVTGDLLLQEQLTEEPAVARTPTR